MLALNRAVWIESVLRVVRLVLLLAALLGQQHRLDVGQHAALGDGDALQQLVQLLIVANGQLQMARVDAGLLVVASGVASQLQHLGRQVFHHCRQIDGRSGTDALGVVALAQQTMNTTDRELQTSPAAPRLGLSFRFASLSASRHDALHENTSRRTRSK
jgi:hypothetical protein